MKRHGRGIAVAALTCALLLPLVPVQATDADLKAAKAAYSQALADYQLARNDNRAYKAAFRAFKDLEHAVKARKEEVAQRFRDEVAIAKAEFDRLKASGLTQAAKNSAAIARDSAIAAAAARRETALAALRPDPVPPQPPKSAQPQRKPPKVQAPAL